MKLTGIVLTHNEAAHIEDCLASLAFCDDRLVFDSYSTDNTVALAQAVGVRVLQHAFEDYPSQRNAALAAAGSADWVLFVDADERVSDELAQEIRMAMQSEGYAGWRIPRHNYIAGVLTRYGGWYPDYQTRLLRVGKAQYDPSRRVHELVMLDGAEGTLTTPLLHYNYRDLAHFHQKQQSYSRYDAQILYEQGIRPKPQNYILQPLRQFYWRYITLEAWRDGFHGLRLSVLMAWYELRKYQHLRGLWRQDET